MAQTFHIICAGPSTWPWIAKPGYGWFDKNVILCNGMPLVWNQDCLNLRWVMIDDIPEGLKAWARSPNPRPRYCTDLNKHAVNNGIVIRHNSKHVMDKPEVSGFFWHGSVGQLACHLSWWLGADRCMVWGLDYQDKKRSYDQVHPSMVAEKKLWDHMDVIESGWGKLVTGLQDLGCKVFNCNPESALKAVPMIDPEKAFKE